MSHRQEMSTSPSYYCSCEPEIDIALLLFVSRHDALSGLAEHAPHPGAVAARLGSKQRPRAARAEAARVGRWWPWLDSNSVTLFVQQYDRGTLCELLLAINTWYLVHGTGTWYRMIRGTCGLRIIRKNRNACFYMEPHGRFYTRTRKFKNGVTNRWGKKDAFYYLKKTCIINSLRPDYCCTVHI